MKTDQPKKRRGALDEETRECGLQEKPGGECMSFDVERSGEWMPSEDLREVALAALEAGGDVAVNLDRIDHLDASALQILLALSVEQKRRGKDLQLAHASPALQKWFEFAGAADQFSMTERKRND